MTLNELYEKNNKELWIKAEDDPDPIIRREAYFYNKNWLKAVNDIDIDPKTRKYANKKLIYQNFEISLANFRDTVMSEIKKDVFKIKAFADKIVNKIKRIKRHAYIHLVISICSFSVVILSLYATITCFVESRLILGSMNFILAGVNIYMGFKGIDWFKENLNAIKALEREIKFRGKSIDNREWLYGHLTFWAGNFQIWVTEDDGSTHNYLVDSKTVGQYTGLKDKTGKEIYGGDIVLIEDQYTDIITDDGRGPIENNNHLCEVSFEKGAFGVIIKEIADWFSEARFYSFGEIKDISGQTEFERVGNKFDYPELLK